jgi:hypothetical protein
MQSTKPFFHALETCLKNRLPRDEFAQVMEESLWEYEVGEGAAGNPEGTGVRAASVRLASICLSFYRAMTKMGMGSESAMETISQASRSLRLPANPDADAACSVAAYFRAKSALPLCRTVFCRACPNFGTGCTQAAPETDDWVAAGKRD